MLRVSNSVLRRWRTCHRAYRYHLVENLEPKVHKIQLYRGTVLHKMLEAHQKGESWKDVLQEARDFLDKLFIEEVEDVEEYQNLGEDLESIFRGYLRHWRGDGISYPHSELELGVELIPGKVELTAKIDAIAEIKGKFWIVEHKTHKKFPTEEFRFTSTQAMIDRWMLEALNYPKVEGIMWDYLKTTPPKEPLILKSGEPSLAVSRIGRTDHYTFKKWLKEHNKDLKDPKYQEALDHLKGDDERFYRRIWLPLDDKMVEEVMSDVRETSLEIYHLGEVSKSRNLSDMNCRGCGYKKLCHSELTGGDTDFIRSREYQPRRKELSIDVEHTELEVDFTEEEEKESVEEI